MAQALATGADGSHFTYCRLCEAQCGLVAEVREGRIVKVGPDRAHPVSEGHLCVKGPGMVSITYDPDRVLTPLKRTGAPGEFVPVGWDEALTDITARLKTIVDRDGGGAVGVYAGNPASFATLHYGYASAFGRALGPAKIFNALHVDTGAKNLAQELLFGSPVHWTFPDLEECDFLILLGANPMVSHMSIISEPRALHKLQAIHERGGVVVVDPRRTETARRFEHVAVRPDSDAWLLAAMLNHIFAQGLEAREVLDGRTAGWTQLRDALRPITPEIAAERCGVAADAIRDLAERFVRARTSACYGRVGTNRGRYSTLTNILIESLNVVAGRFGVAGGWVTGLSPIANPDAPTSFPPYGAQRSRIGNFPLILSYTPGGTLADEITTPGEGQMKALFVDSGNPVHSYPEGDKTAAALEQLELLVSIDFYMTETSRHADYILPAMTFYEREDLTDLWVTNATRPWVQYTPPVIEPQGEARLEYDIYDEILERMGRPSLFAALGTEERPRPGLMQAVDAMFRMGAYGDKFGRNPEGLSVARLREEFPHGARVAERVDAAASWSRVRTEDGRARLWHDVTDAELQRLLAEAAQDDGDALYLFGRRKLGSLNSWMHNVERLVRSDKPTLLMHPDDARDRQIANGARVRIATPVATLEVEAEISDDVVRGSVNYPHGWGHQGGWRRATELPGANINLLASARPEDFEQVSGMAHLDGIRVTVVLLEGAAPLS
ncbi:molybdopterin-containing oxidoreductase family protein [Sphingobium chlorophenolicum]|uniref:Nitrate reductase n=1 Tax=Sphingobium chlorophenolicum TaxID=46429 RepID=A0A081R8U4_SPHCR|nr:molybdopterin-dependent oxidoreductase [Sphingobium chlorophenolicum]KEQ51617.1 Nitrate reductase [Sphingobium chlorophenolicum]